jgi:hypothetical protein
MIVMEFAAEPPIGIAGDPKPNPGTIRPRFA